MIDCADLDFESKVRRRWEMDSKKEEEVRKRRAKPSHGHLNIYQKLVLLGGILTLFLIIGISPGMVSMLAVGVIGATLLIFFSLKYRSQKKETGKKVDLSDKPPDSEEKAVEQQEVLPEVEEKPVKLEEMFPDENKVGDSEEKFHEELEKVGKPRPIFPEEQGKVVVRQDFPVEEKAADIEKWLLKLEEKAVDVRELLLSLEDKAVHLEEALLKLEEKAAHLEEIVLKPGEKIDMQMLLSQDDSFRIGGKACGSPDEDYTNSPPT
jgi:hypothetical protein